MRKLFTILFMLFTVQGFAQVEGYVYTDSLEYYINANGDTLSIIKFTSTITDNHVLTYDSATNTWSAEAGSGLSSETAWTILLNNSSSSAVPTGVLISALTDRAAFGAGDKLVIEESTGELRKIDFSDLPGAGGGISNIVEDTTPQLGGDLDANTFDIQFDDADGIHDSNDNEQLLFQLTASAVNFIEITNAATAGEPLIQAVGSDTDVSLTLDGQGAGTVRTLSSNLDITGNIIVSGTVDGKDIDTNAGMLNEAETISSNWINTDNPWAVNEGGSGAATFTDGGVLLGSGTSAFTAMSVLADGELIVGDGTTDPVAESGATLRTSIGVGTGDSPTFTGLTLTGTLALNGDLITSDGVLVINATSATSFNDENITNVGQLDVDTIIGDGATLVIGDNTETIQINSSDWDISTTGAMTGFSFDADGSGNSITNIENADVKAAAGIVYSKLTFSNNIVAGDIATSGVESTEILDGTILNADINVSAAIVISKTALVAGTNITLLTNTLNVDDAFLLNTGDVGTGAYDFSGASDFEIPNAAAPTTDAFGEIAGDNNAWAGSRGAIQFFDGTANTFVVAALSSDVPTDGQVPKWQTGGTILWENDDDSGGATAWDAIANPSGDGDVGMAELDQDLSWNTAATAAAFDGLTINLTNDATSDAARQVALLVNRPASSGTATIEALLEINNEDTDGAVTSAIEVVSAAGVITNALLLSDSDIVNWADIGANDLITAGGTVTSVELDRLTGLAGIIVTDVTAVTNVDGNSLTITAGTLDVDAASVTVVGAAELATAAETTIGTDAGRAVTPDGLAGSDYGKRVVTIILLDDTQANAVADGQADITFTVPIEMNGWNLVLAHVSLEVTGTTGTQNNQVHNVTQAVNMLSTAITVDTAELTSYTAATPPVVDTANDDVATGDKIRFDTDGVHSGTAAQGLQYILTFQLP